VVTHGDALYLIGGYNGSNSVNDVWTSTDNGVRWSEVLPDKANPTPADNQFPRRSNHAVVSHGNALYVIGGNNGPTTHFNDVWKSTDNGRTWSEVLANKANPTSADNQFPRRGNHTAVVHGNALYVIGGWNSGNFFNDVWKSTDNGQTWSIVRSDTENPPSNNPQFSRRAGHAAVAHGGALYVIGGFNIVINVDLSFSIIALDDVWKSTDNGQTWSKVNQNPGNNPFPGRYRHAVAAHGNDIYVTGGLDRGARPVNDVWRSSDGVSWTRVLGDTETPGNTQFSRRYNHAAVAHDGALYIIGGYDDKSNYLNEVWRSDDGTTWARGITR